MPSESVQAVHHNSYEKANEPKLPENEQMAGETDSDTMQTAELNNFDSQSRQKQLKSVPYDPGTRQRIINTLQRHLGNRYVQRMLHNSSQDVESTSQSLVQGIQSATTGGQSLDASAQEKLENGLGADLSSVRVHTDSQADGLARSVQSEAFTTGQDIFFRSGAYDPTSPGGMHLLAHETTHTIQQASEPVSGTPISEGVSVSDPSDRFEQAAEHSADAVMSGETAKVPAKSASKPVQRQTSTERNQSQTPLATVQRNSIGSTHISIQRSWIGDRTNWVRTATKADNWANPDPPGAYYVLNGLSMDDMIQILRALTAADRKKLADNLNEHAGAFDRSRIQLGLANAESPAGDAAFRNNSENLLWAIRSENYLQPDKGAFAILAAAKGSERDRLIAALNRDALDAVIAHRDEASQVAGGAEVMTSINKERAKIGPTKNEQHLFDLIDGNDWKGFFTELNAMNETDEMRFLNSSIGAVASIRNHIGSAAGIADQDRIRYLLEKATVTASTNLYVDAMVQEYRWQPKYKAKPDEYSRIVLFGDAFDIELDINTIDDGQMSDEEAEQQYNDAKPGPGGFLWPAVRNRSTLPVLWKVKQDIHKQMETLLFDVVLQQGILVVNYILNVILPIAHSMMRASLAALQRAVLSGRWMKGANIVKGRMPPAQIESSVVTFNGKPVSPTYSNWNGLHASGLNPAEVEKAGGLIPPGKNLDILDHVTDKNITGNATQGDGLIATTSNMEFAGKYSQKFGDAHIYKVSGVEGWDAGKIWQQEGKDIAMKFPYGGEAEVSCRAVPWDKVEGWYEVSEGVKPGSYRLGEFHPNPAFKP